MLKRIGLLSAVVLSLTAGAVPAGAQNGPIAYYTFYFDASGNLVGQLHPHCYNGNVTYSLTGVQTAYSDVVEGYICGPNGPEPF